MTKRAIITRMLHNLLGVSGSDPAGHAPLFERDSGHRLPIRPSIIGCAPSSATGSTSATRRWTTWPGCWRKKPAGIDYTRVGELQQRSSVRALCG